MNKSIKIIQSSKITFSISLGIILIGLLVLVFFGFNLGIEFAGGVKLTITSDDISDENYAQVVKAVSDELENTYKLTVNPAQRTTFDGKVNGFEVAYKYEIAGKALQESEYVVLRNIKALFERGPSALTADELATIKTYGVTINETNFKTLDELTPGVTILLEDADVSPSVSQEIFWNALLALGIALIAILIYIFIRFRTLGGIAAGLAAIGALVHDILIMISFVIIAGVIMGLQINSTFVAAVVTIVAYSINNTIVIFDRIRENRGRNNALSNLDLVNNSTYDVLGRTIFTSVTTLAAVIILSVFGVPALLEFTLPIMVGLVAGTYSSMFIAGSLWYAFNKKATKITKAK